MYILKKGMVPSSSVTSMAEHHLVAMYSYAI